MRETSCGSTASGGTTSRRRSATSRSHKRPVEVQVLYPDMGLTESLAAVAERYELDREALQAAAQCALAAPDRVVVLGVAARGSA